MVYRVIVIGEGRHFGLSTSTLLVTVAGEFLDSGRHDIPKGEFSIDITVHSLVCLCTGMCMCLLQVCAHVLKEFIGHKRNKLIKLNQSLN